MTGLWVQAAHRFTRRLKYLPTKMYSNIMSEITNGFSHPFWVKPKRNIISTCNHPNLTEKPRTVVKDLKVQQSVKPWDWSARGAPQEDLLYAMGRKDRHEFYSPYPERSPTQSFICQEGYFHCVGDTRGFTFSLCT